MDIQKGKFEPDNPSFYIGSFIPEVQFMEHVLEVNMRVRVRLRLQLMLGLRLELGLDRVRFRM